MKKIVVLSGAGVSAESGISTFRDQGGLWEGYDVMEVASMEGWRKNRLLVLDFYNSRRAQLKSVVPNSAHKIIAGLETWFDVCVITQNVDDLHERAGSTNIIHLHGELRKVRSEKEAHLIYHWEDDLREGHLCESGHQLRPHIVWFGELVPEIENAVDVIQDADDVIIIGTSMQVYPAAALYRYAPEHARIFYIDPKPDQIPDPRVIYIRDIASKGMESLKLLLLKEL